jgi:hypothetical protein
MKTVRVVSRVLFIVTRVVSLGYLASFLLSALAFSIGWSLNIIEQGSRFEICYPFTHVPYLLGEYNGGYILMFLLLLGLYTLFFFLVGNVFSVFTQTKLFTEQAIKQLKWFYSTNLILPLTAAFIISPFYKIDSPVEILIALHALLGIFTYFIAAIFEQGVNLQKEQDLII